jgi:hypothetical protein
MRYEKMDHLELFSAARRRGEGGRAAMKWDELMDVGQDSESCMLVPVAFREDKGPSPETRVVAGHGDKALWRGIGLGRGIGLRAQALLWPSVPRYTVRLCPSI